MKHKKCRQNRSDFHARLTFVIEFYFVSKQPEWQLSKRITHNNNNKKLKWNKKFQTKQDLSNIELRTQKYVEQHNCNNSIKTC